MPRKPKKQQQQPEVAKSYDEFVDEAEAIDEDAVRAEAEAQAAAEKLRDWRDVEKYKEELNLRRLIDDDLDIDDLPAPKTTAQPTAKRRR